MDRREFLTLAGVSALPPLAGCSTDPPSDSSATRTPSPSSSPTATQTPTRTPYPDITVDDFEFTVSVINQFSPEHPARIETVLTNTGESPLSLSTGITPPFMSFFSSELDDGSQLVIVPDASESVTGRSPLRWADVPEDEEAVPSSPIDGCWLVEYEGVVLLPGWSGELDPGASIAQPFDVYDYQFEKEGDDCPTAGQYEFVDRLDLSPGNPDHTVSYETTLRFTLIINDDESIEVSVPEPEVAEYPN